MSQVRTRRDSFRGGDICKDRIRNQVLHGETGDALSAAEQIQGAHYLTPISQLSWAGRLDSVAPETTWRFTGFHRRQTLDQGGEISSR